MGNKRSSEQLILSHGDCWPASRVHPASHEVVNTSSRPLAFKLYILFIVSFFLHLPARIPVLGLIRFDLLLVAVIGALVVSSQQREANGSVSETDRIFRMLLGYFAVSVPLVEWPGSVLWTGIPNLIKAVIFYFFTVSIITTQERLRVFMGVFIACQSFRILEPVYLHIVDDYWGDVTHIEYGAFMDRLSGAPSDVINPNGLAFVIVTVIPFFHYLTLSSRMMYRLVYFGLLPVFIYALVLTASRSGMLCLGAILIGIFLRSQRKFLLIIVASVGAFVVVANMNDLQKERYLSIYRDDVHFAESSQGRQEGVLKNLEVALNRPIFGHGLGTSLEANWHAYGEAKPAHNLYIEILQEGGIVGLVLFLMLLKSIIVNFRVSLNETRQCIGEHSYLGRLTMAMQVWLAMNILSSFATYGLSSYHWYLFAGLSVVLVRLGKLELEHAEGGTIHGD